MSDHFLTGYAQSCRNGYYAPELIPLHGKKVYARYNTDDTRKVYIFNERDVFICIADIVEAVPHISPVTAQEVREVNRRNKALRQHVRSKRPKENPITIQEYVAAAATTEESKDNAITVLSPVTHKQADVIQREEDRRAARAGAAGEQNKRDLREGMKKLIKID